MVRLLLVLPLLLLPPAGCKRRAPTADAGLTTRVTGTPQAELPETLPLREELRSGDPAVRARACATVGPAEYPAPPPELLAALGDPEPDVRKAAVRAVLGFQLQNVDASALPLLLQLAERDPSTPVRREALRALGALSHRDVVPPLLRRYAVEADAEARALVLEVVTRDGDRRAQPLVLTLLADREPLDAALEASRRVLEKAPPSLLRLLTHPRATTRRLAALALGELGDPAAVPALLRAARNGDSSVVAEALGSLAHLGGPEAVPVLLERCTHPDPTVRVAALRALGSYRTPDDIAADEAAPRVLELLGPGPEAVRVEAARTLGAARLRRAFAPLRGVALATAEPVAVRCAAIEALGALGVGAAPALLGGLLADESGDVRTAAATALGLLGKDGATAIPALLQALAKRGEDLEPTLAVVRALGLLSAHEAAGPLTELGDQSENPLLQTEAGGALLRLGRAEGAALLRPVLLTATEWPERAHAARRLETRAWRSRRAEPVTDAQQVLATAVTTLIRDALRVETEPLVREELYRQLGRADGPAALPALREGLEERVPTFRLRAAAGLCRNGELRGCEVLIAGLDAPDAAVRAEAARRCGDHAVEGARAALRKAATDPVGFVARAARRALLHLDEGREP